MARVTQTTQQKHTERIKITGERDSNAYKKRLKDKNMIPSLQGSKKKLAFYFLFFWLWSRCWTQSNKSSSFRSGFFPLEKYICSRARYGTSRESLHYNVMVVPLLLLCLDKWKSNFILHYHHYYYYTPLLSWEST